MKGKESISKLQTMEGDGLSEVFMYGIFGESQSYMSDVEAAKYMSDIDFTLNLGTLSKIYTRINYRLNSPGGSMKHGLPCITQVRKNDYTACDLHVYNDGIAASMAADFFLAFPKKNRHMAANALLMIHAPIDSMYGNENDHQDCINKLRQFAQTTIDILADSMGKTADEVRTQFYADGKDHWLTAKDCLDLGIIDGIETYEAQTTLVEPQKLAYPHLMQAFTQHPDSFKIHFFDNEKDDSDMTTEDIAKALAEGKIDKATLLAAIGAVEKVVEAPPSVPTVEDFSKMVADAVKIAVEPLTAKNEELTAKIVELGKRTQGPTLLLSNGEVHGEQDDLMKIFEERQNALAKESTPFSNSY
jgi:ATP-dependent protease ClpP protease subunit